MLKEKKDIGIIIPYINLPHYILELIKTISTKYSYQIYLIDNNSDKETKKELAHLVNQENITIIQNDTNIGCASAWNQGIKKAINEHDIDFAVVLNNDILLHPECIDNMIFESRAGSFPLVTGFDLCKECAKPLDILDLKVPFNHYVVDAPQFSCYTLNIRLLNKLKEREKGIEEYPGLFDQKYYPAYFEDNDFHYRLKLAKMRGVTTTSAIYYHYGSRTTKENPEINAINSHYYLANEQRYLEKWGGKPGQEKSKIPFDHLQ